MMFTCPKCGLTQPVTDRSFPVRCKTTCEVVAENRDHPGISAAEWLPPAKREKPVAVADQRIQPCIHRGERVRRVPCVACGGGKEVQIYACDQLGECTLANRIDGVACCATCPAEIRDRPVACNVEPATISNLAVVTSFFNPHNSRRRVAIYPRFAAALRSQGLPLFCAEGLFPGVQSQVDSTWQVMIDAEAQFWHKESLLNFAIAMLPDKYDAVMWIDADLIYEDIDIGGKVIDQLSTFAVVQPWSIITYLDQNDVPIPSGRKLFSMAWHNRGRSLATADSRHSYPGGIWAARRETLAMCGGIYDEAITGGGDTVWAAGAVGDRNAVNLSSWPAGYRSHMLSWSTRLAELSGCRAGVVDTEIKHLYHGSREDRQYQSRHEALRRFAFDPTRHLHRDAHGMLSWSKDSPLGLRAEVQNYIHSRREDD